MRAEVIEYHPERITDPVTIGSVCAKPQQCAQLRKQIVAGQLGRGWEEKYQQLHPRAS